MGGPTERFHLGDIFRKVYIAITDLTGALRVQVLGSVDGSFTPGGLTTAGKITKQNITKLAWQQMPATQQADNNLITVQNNETDGSVVLWNYDNAAAADEGFRIYGDGGFKSMLITNSIPVYCRLEASSPQSDIDVVVEEVS